MLDLTVGVLNSCNTRQSHYRAKNTFLLLKNWRSWKEIFFLNLRSRILFPHSTEMWTLVQPLFRKSSRNFPSFGDSQWVTAICWELTCNGLVYHPGGAKDSYPLIITETGDKNRLQWATWLGKGLLYYPLPLAVCERCVLRIYLKVATHYGSKENWSRFMIHRAPY